MKLKRSLQHVTTCKSDAQKKKNGNALVHNFVALSACATLAMILAVGTKVAEFGPRSQVYAASDKENRSADAWTDLGSVEYDLPTGIAGMVTSVADTPSAGTSVTRIGTSCERVMVGQRVKQIKGNVDELNVGDSMADTVASLDDPRLVSIAALRRRGFTPSSIKKFVELCGISKSNSSVDYAMLEYCIREDLKLKASRAMAVLDPIKLVIDNYPEGQTEELEVDNNMENPELGKRVVPFGREVYIEREDFMEEPPKKYRRLYPGNEVRLMNAYFVTCTGFEKDEDGKVTVVHCTYDPESRGGNSPDGRKVRGTIHWVSAADAVKAQVRLYENIIDEEKGVYNEDGSLNLNPNSLTVLDNCYVEPSLLKAEKYDSFQFVRNGFFCVDAKDSTSEHPVFNRIVSLKSSYKLPTQA